MPTSIPTSEVTTRLHSRGSRTDNAHDQLDSDVTMDENNQINSVAHNTEGVLLI
jgi:hypothetical protein